MKRYAFLMALTIMVLVAAVLAYPVFAHQPYFEAVDITLESPWPVDDPTVSTAIYATLESQVDVDFFSFAGKAGQTILLEMTIPQIDGQEEFAPTMALLGPGLPTEDVPLQIEHPTSDGWLLLPPLLGPAQEFYEPFSRTSYWERQSQRVGLPADGQYIVAVWHGSGEMGRYVFVVGDKERLGGDPGFATRLDTYWTPVTQAPVEAPAALDHCQFGS